MPAQVRVNEDGSLPALGKARADASKDLAHDIDALTAHVRDISGMRASANPNNAWAFPPRDTHNLQFLSGELDSLMLAVDGSDAPPSPDSPRSRNSI